MYDIVRARSDLLAVADALQAGRPDDRASGLEGSSQADPWSWPLWGAQAGATPQGPAIWSLFEKLFFFLLVCYLFDMWFDHEPFCITLYIIITYMQWFDDIPGQTLLSLTWLIFDLRRCDLGRQMTTPPTRRHVASAGRPWCMSLPILSCRRHCRRSWRSRRCWWRFLDGFDLPICNLRPWLVTYDMTYMTYDSWWLMTSWHDDSWFWWLMTCDF